MTTPTLQKIIDAPVARVEIGKEWFDLSKTNVYSLSQLQQAYQAGRKDAFVEAADICDLHDAGSPVYIKNDILRLAEERGEK